MAKANRKQRRALETVKKKYIEATGCEVGEDDGVVYTHFEAFGRDDWRFPHPLFAPEDWQQAVDGAKTNRDKAEAVLGEQQFAEFHAAGGSPSDVMLIFMDVSQSMQDELAGGDPTQS